ncbi:arginase family protein [Campylobacter concisus]|uniref:hypothetical protein n=1 Tax=Campylobacter concisus TaxID=199 RepID=UPI00122CB50A|nr:hypothetical protein [Campylobacter concisus]
MVCTKQEKELLIAFDQKLLEIQREMTAEYLSIKELFKANFDHDQNMIDTVCEVSFYMKDYEEEILSVELQDFYFEDGDDLSGIELCCDGKLQGFDCSIILTKMHSASITIEEILSIDDICWHFEPQLYYKKEKISAALNEKLIWMPIVSSDNYNIYLPKGVREAGTFKDFDNMYIRNSFLTSWFDFEYKILPKSYKNFITRFRQTPTQSFIDLDSFHSKEYLSKLYKDYEFAQQTTGLMISKYVPLNMIARGILDAYKAMCEGTLHACKLALELGFAINARGGFEYSTKNSGAVRAPYNDIALSVIKLHKDRPDLKILYVNFGNKKSEGVFELAQDDKSLWVYEIYSGCDRFFRDIFPNLDNVYCDSILPNTTKEQYLQNIKDGLSKVISNIKPDLIIYSSDVSMRFGYFAVDVNLLIERDAVVTALARDNKTPLCVCISSDPFQDTRHKEMVPFYKRLIEDMLCVIVQKRSEK